ncbi:D-2-hydroxyacid dehydrogenase [Halopenitus persicus]|uniref:Phosphoglycerate dehydrogenase n=1 Tax=Halopenitus persicus TaxID=1048396 RepID=A0A1H3L302_9EURY|nr:D-2-hydroxyacid dehydrogenase [Halopenitus persicus]SDY58599.1 Phosphoglycerate dehydrogenase [Halopenitus persicus]
MTRDPDVVVFRQGTEALSPASYADAIRRRLPDLTVALAETPREERDLLPGARIATGISITDEQVELAEELELFVVASSGTDHLPMDRLRDRGILVANASGIHAPGIAEQVLGYLLVFARRIHQGIRQQADNRWRHYQATELMGSTVTVVGLGAIGHAIAERLDAFGVETIGVRYTPEKGGPTDEVVGFDDDDLHAAFARSEYVVLCSPLTETTRRLIGPDEIATLGPDSVVVNVGRGPLVDTDALVEALQVGDLAGCALDVTDPEPLPNDHPLWDLDNAIITPHMGGHTPEHWPRLADVLAENARRLEEGADRDRLRNLVS